MIPVYALASAAWWKIWRSFLVLSIGEDSNCVHEDFADVCAFFLFQGVRYSLIGDSTRRIPDQTMSDVLLGRFAYQMSS